MNIAVLCHADDVGVAERGYLIHYLGDFWRQQGHTVEFFHGLDDRAAMLASDLLIPHVDLTRTPEAYATFLAQHPCVLNRRVLDISKRLISRDLVAPGDGYEGPVIVKTDENFGGMSEADARWRRETAGWLGPGRRLLRRLTRALARLRPHRSPGSALARATHLAHYPVFERRRDVPSGVFDNRALVVERFLPERAGDLYCVRYYVFLGDRSLCARIGAKVPIVKGEDIVSVERVSVHPDIEARRIEMGFDFGKFDYVERDGRAILIDANRTPGRPGNEATSVANAAELGPGLDGALRSLRGASPAPRLPPGAATS